MNVFTCTNCNCVSNPCDHPPFFLWTHLCLHYWIFISIWLCIQKAESADPLRTSLLFTESAFFPQTFLLRSDYELPWLGLRIIAKYLVFRNKRNCIQRRHVTTRLSLLADRVMFLLQITSLCLHTESSICHRSEAIWNSSALMTPFFSPAKRRDRFLNKSLFNNLFTMYCRR